LNRHTLITYCAAAGNVGIWIMAGILSEGGTIHPFLKVAVIGFSAFCLGIAMAFGLVEIAAKLSSMPAEFERTKNGATIKKPNRRYQAGRAVLYGIIGGESFLLMPVVVALATDTPLADNLPGIWLWVWGFARVAAAAALLAGLAAVMESTPSRKAAGEPQVKAQPDPQPAPDAKAQNSNAPHKIYVCEKCGETLPTASAKAHHVRWKKCKERKP